MNTRKRQTVTTYEVIRRAKVSVGMSFTVGQKFKDGDYPAWVIAHLLAQNYIRPLAPGMEANNA